MIQVKNLNKNYGNKSALTNVSFTVKSGEIVGFLGPNGAGKTTTMNIICGYISSSSGTVLINDMDNLKEPLKTKALIGYLPENPPLYLDMTVIDYLNFVYQLKKAKQPQKEHIDSIMERVKIEHVQTRIIKQLSKGYKQRVGLAQALIGDPEILILDEPTVGLDPKQINEMRDLIKNLGEDKTVILSSHILPEINAVCDRVLIISKGEIVADEEPKVLSDKLTNNNLLTATALCDSERAKEIISAVNNIANINYMEEQNATGDITTRIQINTEKNVDIRADIFFAFSNAGVALIELNRKNLTLEEIFLKVTNDDFMKQENADETKDAEMIEDAEMLKDAEMVDEAEKIKKTEEEKAINEVEFSSITDIDEHGENKGGTQDESNI